MREMKNSGIPWIGDIPSHWITVSFKSLVRNVSTGLNPRDNFELSKDAEFYYVTIRNFKDGKLYLDEKCDRIDRRAWEIIQSRSELQKGDILFASISKDAQCYILTEYPNNWNINESVFALRGNYEKVYDKYLYYSLINPAYYNDLRIDATGTTFQSIKQKKLKDSTLLLPPLSEQQAIADFLDKKCAEIDEMIALQEKIIEELKAYKQSVITEAVTKGLNPNVPMKDSGVEWVGEIPEGWSVIRIKDTGYLYGGLTGKAGDDFNMDDYDGAYMLYVPFTNIFNNSVIDTDILYKVKIQYGEKQNLVDKGDILFLMSSEDYDGVGKPAIMENHVENLGLNSFCKGLRITNSSIVPKYLFYHISSHLIREMIRQEAKGFIRINLRQDKLSSCPIFVPPTSEQQAIADYLDTKCSAIDNLISLKQAKIETLKEYKKSIIYEYVTGKKEIS